MTTKTREEAIEEIKTEIAGDVLNGSTVRNYEERSDSVRYQYWDKTQSLSDTPYTITIRFTPPKPEFKKGTIGLDSVGNYCQYLYFRDNQYRVVNHKDHTNNRMGYHSETFTPIYQADPIEKLAFEMIARDYSLDLKHNHIPARYFDSRSLEIERFKAHFLSKAKEELSK